MPDKSAEYMFNPDKTPNDYFDALLRAVGQYIIDEIGDRNDRMLSPRKLAAFYRAVGGNYDSLFVEVSPQSISYIWQVTGCQHSLQPDPSDDFVAPFVPALTIRGFVRWESIETLLGPDEHVPFLQFAVENWPLRHPDTGEPFAKHLPRDAFPAEPDPDIERWHTQCAERLRRDATPDARPERAQSETAAASDTRPREGSYSSHDHSHGHSYHHSHHHAGGARTHGPPTPTVLYTPSMPYHRSDPDYFTRPVGVSYRGRFAANYSEPHRTPSRDTAERNRGERRPAREYYVTRPRYSPERRTRHRSCSDHLESPHAAADGPVRKGPMPTSAPSSSVGGMRPSLSQWHGHHTSHQPNHSSPSYISMSSLGDNDENDDTPKHKTKTRYYAATNYSSPHGASQPTHAVRRIIPVPMPVAVGSETGAPPPPPVVPLTPSSDDEARRRHRAPRIIALPFDWREKAAAKLTAFMPPHQRAAAKATVRRDQERSRSLGYRLSREWSNGDESDADIANTEEGGDDHELEEEIGGGTPPSLRQRRRARERPRTTAAENVRSRIPRDLHREHERERERERDRDRNRDHEHVKPRGEVPRRGSHSDRVRGGPVRERDLSPPSQRDPRYYGRPDRRRRASSHADIDRPRRRASDRMEWDCPRESHRGRADSAAFSRPDDRSRWEAGMLNGGSAVLTGVGGRRYPTDTGY